MAPAMNSSRPRSTLVVRWSRRLALAPIVAGLLVSVAAGKYAGGTGSVDNPYVILTAEDLDLLGSSQGDWNKNFRLGADIDLKDCNETNFHLIGYWGSWGDPTNKPFSGKFDGNGRTISNLRYRDMKGSGIGLFRYVDMGDIKNLRLKNVKIVTEGTYIGSLVGYFEDGGIIDCHVTGADVTGKSHVGGMVGSADGSISQCSSRGRVAGILYVGGLAGQVGEGTIKQSYSKASVSGNDSVGGLVGVVLQETSAVDSCYANGAVDGVMYVGGLVGQIGSGRVYKSYSTGAVSGSQATGGLVGNKRVLGDVILSFWDAQTSGQTAGAGGTPKNTPEMWSANTFAGWDFNFTWSICEGRNYPVFWWQVPTADLRCPDGVHWIDFASFAMQWERHDCTAVNDNCDWADFDGSGDVGFPDLAILAEEWLTGMY
ncbi:MAG: hypothetical protein EHM35_03640 [Planctomycetaceae bacterium]|nr:MAG: hypothetical protein EHM35_03640 [Planctomycetaceae bacterium]